jgi:hypothetical protein
VYLAGFACTRDGCGQTIWQTREDMYEWGYFPCSTDPDCVKYFASFDVLNDWRIRFNCNPGGSFEGYINELNARSLDQGLVRTMLHVLADDGAGCYGLSLSCALQECSIKADRIREGFEQWTFLYQEKGMLGNTPPDQCPVCSKRHRRGACDGCFKVLVHAKADQRQPEPEPYFVNKEGSIFLDDR